MKTIRLLITGSVLAGTLLTASPAQASCGRELKTVCTTMCRIGLGNKLTEPAFQWCYIA